MACFTAVAVEAIVVTAIAKAVKTKEEEKFKISLNSDISSSENVQNKISWSQKLNWLVAMLWGGVFLLTIEHIWHGEVVPWPPFLTAMNNPADIQPMLMEIATVGGSMILFVTAIWVVMVLVADHIAKKSEQLTPVPETGAK